MKPVVLAVFGHSIHYVSADTARSRQLPEGADLVGALLQLIAEAAEKPKSVGLVYHPADLQVVAAECANDSRSKLRAYFVGEHRELSNPATLWAATRPAPHRDGKFATLLHYEPRPRLEHLLHVLEENGIRVRIALPPAAALVHRTRTAQLDLAILAAEGGYFFYHVNELGIPTGRFGSDFGSLGEHCGVAVASRKELPAHVLVVADSPLQPVLDLLETHGLRDQTQMETWPEFLGSVAFAANDPANFALRPFAWQPRHTLHLIAAGLALAASGLTWDYVSIRIRAHHVALALDRQREELKRDIVRLEAVEKSYREAEALLAAVPMANPRPSVLLDTVTQALPPSLQLLACRYQAGQFSLEGLAFEGIGQEKGPYAAFLEALGHGSRPWALKPAKPAPAASNWTLHGTFNP
jgi:Tfp pilus assembly protein PilN